MRRLIPLIPLALIACNGDGNGDGGPFTLTVSIPDSYFGPHAGVDFDLAVVTTDGEVEAETSGALPAAAGAADEHDLTVADGSGYSVHFWVDSDLDGGTAGACDGDPDFFDHQWEYDLGTVDADRDFALPAHNLDFTDVCATFE